jgi:hypothetical protein
MSKEEVIKKIIELKENSIKEQDYEMASKLRDIENSFNGRYFSMIANKVYIEPNLKNLKIELNKLVEYFYKNTQRLPQLNHSQCFRDIKLILILDEL